MNRRKYFLYLLRYLNAFPYNISVHYRKKRIFAVDKLMRKRIDKKVS